MKCTALGLVTLIFHMESYAVSFEMNDCDMELEIKENREEAKFYCKSETTYDLCILSDNTHHICDHQYNIHHSVDSCICSIKCTVQYKYIRIYVSQHNCSIILSGIRSRDIGNWTLWIWETGSQDPTLIPFLRQFSDKNEFGVSGYQIIPARNIEVHHSRLNNFEEEGCYEYDTDYRNHDINLSTATTTDIRGSAQGCQTLCYETVRCKYFTYNKQLGACYLKDDQTFKEAAKSYAISGPKVCSRHIEDTLQNNDDNENESSGTILEELYLKEVQKGNRYAPGDEQRWENELEEAEFPRQNRNPPSDVEQKILNSETPNTIGIVETNRKANKFLISALVSGGIALLVIAGLVVCVVIRKYMDRRQSSSMVYGNNVTTNYDSGHISEEIDDESNDNSNDIQSNSSDGATIGNILNIDYDVAHISEEAEEYSNDDLNHTQANTFGSNAQEMRLEVVENPYYGNDV